MGFGHTIIKPLPPLLFEYNVLIDSLTSCNFFNDIVDNRIYLSLFDLTGKIWFVGNIYQRIIGKGFKSHKIKRQGCKDRTRNENYYSTNKDVKYKARETDIG